jgi:hypothetical protein
MEADARRSLTGTYFADFVRVAKSRDFEDGRSAGGFLLLEAMSLDSAEPWKAVIDRAVLLEFLGCVLWKNGLVELMHALVVATLEDHLPKP